MKQNFLLCFVLLLVVPIVGAQDEPTIVVTCDETLSFELPEGLLLKEFPPSLDKDDIGGHIVLATREELLEPFPTALEPDDIHITLMRQSAAEDIEPAQYLSTFTQFTPHRLTINEQPAAVVYQQDPATGVQQILLVMSVSDEVNLWIIAVTLNRFAELELLTDTLVHSVSSPDSPIEEDYRYYFTEDCYTRFEYPAEWTVALSDDQNILIVSGPEQAALMIIPPEHLWEYFHDLDPELVTIDQLFNAYIEAHDMSPDSDIEWDGENSWTLTTKNGMVMVREYDDQQVVMFFVYTSDDKSFEAQIDKILASFSVNSDSR